MRSAGASCAPRAIGIAAALACLGAACSFGAGGVRPGAPGPTSEATKTTIDSPATTLPVAPGDAPEAYGFTFEQEVTSGRDSWSVTVSGRVVGANLTCRVQTTGAGLALDRDLILAGGRLWSRDHSAAGYREIGGGNPTERALLAYCPPWPPAPAAAGLAGLAAGEPARHTVGGVTALGYRSDASGLAAAIGTDLGSTAVEVFNFWIAAEEGWLLEVNLSVSGPGADLAPLLGSLPVPDGPTSLTARHRLDLAVSTAPIAPPA
ncbi:MAG: hypothetical protein MUE66_00130 [Acidimicrobiia bacterium]|jgi:hypothetical protein|nr:hypothetical protein [Acidimicrobiia bacterium]